MRNSFHFTLIEVVVSLAILSIGIVGLLQLSAAAQKRIAKVHEMWMHTHMLSQAAEYYLLMKEEEEPPEITEDFFPYENYTVIRTIEDLEEEDLPEDFNNLSGQLPLKTLVLELQRRSDGKTIDKFMIDRLSYESSPNSSISN